MNKNEVRKILEGADKLKYSHIIICVDTWNYGYFVEYVKRENDIDSFIERFWKEYEDGMFKIVEIYNLDLDIEKQLSEFKSHHKEKTKKISEKALRFATIKHEGQYRKGKDVKPYIIHPTNVAKLMLRYKGNSHNIDNLIAASYLHDTLEDTNTTYYDLVKYFGHEIASLVLELTTDKDLKNEIGKTKYLAIKMKNMSSWALDIKLCDRLDNISDLNKTDDVFKDKYINETLYIINYLIKNRKLTNTQLNIIKTILIVLEVIIINTYDDNSKETHGIMKLKNSIKTI